MQAAISEIRQCLGVQQNEEPAQSASEPLSSLADDELEQVLNLSICSKASIKNEVETDGEQEEKIETDIEDHGVPPSSPTLPCVYDYSGTDDSDETGYEANNDATAESDSEDFFYAAQSEIPKPRSPGVKP